MQAAWPGFDVWLGLYPLECHVVSHWDSVSCQAGTTDPSLEVNKSEREAASVAQTKNANSITSDPRMNAGKHVANFNVIRHGEVLRKLFSFWMRKRTFTISASGSSCQHPWALQSAQEYSQLSPLDGKLLPRNGGCSSKLRNWTTKLILPLTSVRNICVRINLAFYPWNSSPTVNATSEKTSLLTFQERKLQDTWQEFLPVAERGGPEK